MLERAIGAYHVGITVEDMSRSLAFYRDGLGLLVVRDFTVTAQYVRDELNLDVPAIRAVYLAIPGSDLLIELLEYQEIHGRRLDPLPSDRGAGHLCLWVADVEATHRALGEMGYRSRSEAPIAITDGPNKGRLVAYMLDPDGFFVEMIQEANA